VARAARGPRGAHGAPARDAGSGGHAAASRRSAHLLDVLAGAGGERGTGGLVPGPSSRVRDPAAGRLRSRAAGRTGPPHRPAAADRRGRRVRRTDGAPGMSWRMGDSIRRRSGRGTGRAPRGGARPGAAARWLGFALLIALVAFGTGYAIAARVLFPPPPETDAGLAVPSLVGRSAADARRQLQERGLEVAEVLELPHPDRPAGVVVAQSPLPGQHLRPGGGVSLGISSGPPRARVPDVTGLLAERAAALAGMVGFQVEQRSEESELPAGTVIRIEPAPGTELVVPASLALIVSSGPPVLPEDSLAPELVQQDTLVQDTVPPFPPVQ